MARIPLTYSIRNPLSFLLTFFPFFGFIFSIPSISVNDNKKNYVLKHDCVFGPFSESL